MMQKREENATAEPKIEAVENQEWYRNLLNQLAATTKKEKAAEAKIDGDTVPFAPSLKELAERSESYKIAKKENSGWLTFYTILAICTGVALSGAAIPFFLNTTIPLLMFLSNKIVLASLTVVQIAVWASIYGQNNSGFISDSYWRNIVKKDTTENEESNKAEISETNDLSIQEKLFNGFKSLVNNWFPSSALSQRYLKDEEESWEHEIAEIDAIVKSVVDGNSAKDINNQIEDARNKILQHLIEKYGEIDNNKLYKALEETISVYEKHISHSESFTKITNLSPADITRLANKEANKSAEKMPELSSSISYNWHKEKGGKDTGWVEMWQDGKFERTKLDKSTGTIESQANEEFKETFEARKAIIKSILDKKDFAEFSKVDSFKSDPENNAQKSANQLFLANNYLSFIKGVDVFADFVGVINAIFVNAAGVCISAMQLMAFVANIGVKLGFLASPIVPAPIALFVLCLGMLAGWNAAHTVTRMKTREVLREIAFNLVYWWNNENKWKLSNYLNWGKSYSFLASLIAMVLSVGFCCFNAATGAILGDTLYKIFVYHNLTCITTPSIILNPVITPSTWIGKLLWALGLLLTIPSTGAFLVGIERAWIAGFSNNVRALVNYCKNQIKYKVAYNYYIGLVISFAILPVCYVVFNAIGIIPALPLFQVALASIIIPSLYAISMDIYAKGFRSIDEIKGILTQSTATLLVLLMTFATAAQITILTSTSPMWLFVLTQPQLNIWAAVTCVCGLVGFLYMFNGGLAGTIAPKPSSIKSEDINSSAKSLSSATPPRSTFDNIYCPADNTTSNPSK